MKGYTLKAARVNKGYSQKEAGEMIGVSRDVISNWERQKTYPSIKQLKEIEKVYEIDYQDIIFCPSNPL